MRNSGAKIELKKKWAQNIWVSGITFLDAPPPLLRNFLSLFSGTFSPYTIWMAADEIFFFCAGQYFFSLASKRIHAMCLLG